MKVFSIGLALALAASASAAIVHVPGTKPDNLLEPLQQRLAFAGPDGMTVSWNTYQQLDKPTVQYGKDPLHLNMVTTSDESITYPTSLTWNNHVTLTGLEPGTKYWYRVSNTDCYNCSEIPTYTFTTALPAGDKTPFSFAVAVDMGLMGTKYGLSNTVGTGAGNPLGSNDTDTVQSLLENIDTYEFMWHPGDIAYADYWLKEEIQNYIPGYEYMNQTHLFEKGINVYESMLEQFFDEITPVTAIRPYMVGPGNHDADCDNGGTSDKVHNISYTDMPCFPGQTNFTGYQHHWRMPSKQSNGLGNFWYSWDYGLVHFVNMDTETDLGTSYTGPVENGGVEDFHGIRSFGYPNQQLEFLRKDLASVDRTKTPWVIVSGHRPFYGEDMIGSSVCGVCRDALESILDEYGVDLLLSGHVHNYERMMPMSHNGTIDERGLDNPTAKWVIMNGAAGHYDGLDPLNPQYGGSYIVKAFDTAYGWSRLTVHNATHLTHEFVASRNNTVLDTATLYKEHNFRKGAKHNNDQNHENQHQGKPHGHGN